MSQGRERGWAPSLHHLPHGVFAQRVPGQALSCPDGQSAPSPRWGMGTPGLARVEEGQVALREAGPLACPPVGRHWWAGTGPLDMGQRVVARDSPSGVRRLVCSLLSEPPPHGCGPDVGTLSPARLLSLPRAPGIHASHWGCRDPANPWCPSCPGAKAGNATAWQPPFIAWGVKDKKWGPYLDSLALSPQPVPGQAPGWSGMH